MGRIRGLVGTENPKKLNYLYIGPGASVQDITPLGKLKSLIVLHVENFKRIAEYSPLAALGKLEQLVISGPVLGTTPIKDLEFLRDLQSLVSVWLPNTTIDKRYTKAELASLRAALPNLHDMYACIWGSGA